MSQQMNLFPDSSIAASEIYEDGRPIDQDIELNAVDEIFSASHRLHNHKEYVNLLNFISRFPNYSPFNCFLLFIQNPAISYVATARTWNRKFRRRPKIDARPMMILAPMGPIRFVFDVKDTEGHPVAEGLLASPIAKPKHFSKIYENTIFNCTIQGISVYETSLEQENMDTATRITPALRKKYKDLELKKDSNYLIIINRRHSLEDKYSSLVYELGHIFCGHLGIDSNAWWSERRGVNVAGEQIEAESTALLVCRRSGLLAVSEKYRAERAANLQQLPAFSLNAVFQAVNYIEDMGKSRWSQPKKSSRY
ncbi:MAG: ImmA/IrrE family metallo-endopeptidase [Desulfobacteraceae bacterium]